MQNIMLKNIANVFALRDLIAGILRVKNGDVEIINPELLKKHLIDDLIFIAVFSPDADTMQAARWLIMRAGIALGIVPASIQGLYESMGRGEVKRITVPAINIRAMTYDTARAAFRAAIKGNVGAVIFEIARSEIDYTMQRPEEYACAVMAAAIKEGYTGPLFLQGDHFQINAKKYAKDAGGETQAVKTLIKEGIKAGFFNIDIDTSTLVELEHPTVKEQQRKNYSLAAALTVLIREIEPPGVTVSVGGEIGEVGGKNSTIEELQAFMEGYNDTLRTYEKYGEFLNEKPLTGISKISVQTGTTHGGVPMPDGTIAKVKLDFDTLKKLSDAARKDHGLGGAVQHGASTLPNEAFDRFPAIGTAEIHLATGFQNIIYDSAHFPAELKDRIYSYLDLEFAGEKKEVDTPEQFIYKTRKKGFGHFKKDLWTLPAETRQAIGEELENQFAFLFGKLNVGDTMDIVGQHVNTIDIRQEIPAAFARALQ